MTLLSVSSSVGYFVAPALATSAVPMSIATPTPASATILIAVDGMHCERCARGIAAMLKRTAGVVSADVSYERREARVEYDLAAASPARLVEAITNLGYSAKVKD